MTEIVPLTLHEMWMGKSQAEVLKERILEDLQHAALLDGLARQAVDTFIDHITGAEDSLELEGFSCSATLDYATLHPHIARDLKEACIEKEDSE